MSTFLFLVFASLPETQISDCTAPAHYQSIQEQVAFLPRLARHKLQKSAYIQLEKLMCGYSRNAAGNRKIVRFVTIEKVVLQGAVGEP